MNILSKPKIVLLGMMTNMPVAGNVWLVMQYLLGFQRLGYDAYYVECHGLNPSMFARTKVSDSATLAAEFIAKVMARFDFQDRWSFQALHADGRYFGVSERKVKDLYASAELIINLHGGTMPQPEHFATGRLVYVGTDPVQTEVELDRGETKCADFLAKHCAIFTWGENYGRPDCQVPVSDRFRFIPTRAPVILDFWQSVLPPGDVFTTIGNWRQLGRDLEFRGEVYRWSKHHEFLKFLDLPARTAQKFELALSPRRFEEEDRRLLEGNGWQVRDSLSFSTDLDGYRRYIAQSRGEFTVAKDQNVRLRSGWFSERSAQYLASGRPVITQETGFSNILPTGEGLFGFTTLDEAAAAVASVNADWDRHSRAAREIAREYFSYDVVLTRLLKDAGLEAPAQRLRATAPIETQAGKSPPEVDEGVNLGRIVRRARRSEYDFRTTACAQDPLAHLFSQWVDYYKLKRSIASELRPASILEIGVRFGYSAAAFLHANPAARYVGIDLDCDRFGGVNGAIEWARKIIAPFDATFVISDTQKMERLPGGVYDLIHVDGQQDAQGFPRDLALALKQARYVLVDGYLWTRSNFLNLSESLLRHADIVDWYGVIPGYAGDLLIKVSDQYLEQSQALARTADGSSLPLRKCYSEEYYLKDCGGFESYTKHRGQVLQDGRLQAVAALTLLRGSGRALDLGCGRGELSYFLATHGFEVTAIDYSAAALCLAEKCFADDDGLRDAVAFVRGSICTAPLEGHYRVAIAADVIEHLAPAEVDQLYARVSDHLTPDGLLVVHTFPNAWYYRFDYPRRRRIADSVGAYLPEEPRSRYEQLMHINEQSPAVLQRQLEEHFRHVVLWFGDPADPGGSLIRRFTRRELCAARDLFAVASNEPISVAALRRCLVMDPLPSLAEGALSIMAKTPPQAVAVNSEFLIDLDIGNHTDVPLTSYPPHPIYVAYHWLDHTGASVVVWDGERTPALVAARGRCHAKITIKAPDKTGDYLLRITLVQEKVRWLDEEPTRLFVDLAIAVGKQLNCADRHLADSLERLATSVEDLSRGGERHGNFAKECVGK